MGFENTSVKKIIFMPNHGDRKMGVCDVDSLVDNDNRMREVYYCSDCNAWICKKCEGNIPRRALAMVTKPVKKLFA